MQRNSSSIPFRATGTLPFPALVLVLAAAAGCPAPQAPDSLVELREAISGESLEAGRQAAPDLVAEAERSLAASERALARGDGASATRMATLGCIQARTAFAIARQRRAQERLDRARSLAAGAEEDLARYVSDTVDAAAEIERLDALGTRAPTLAPAE